MNCCATPSARRASLWPLWPRCRQPERARCCGVVLRLSHKCGECMGSMRMCARRPPLWGEPRASSPGVGQRCQRRTRARAHAWPPCMRACRWRCSRQTFRRPGSPPSRSRRPAPAEQPAAGAWCGGGALCCPLAAPGALRCPPHGAGVPRGGAGPQRSAGDGGGQRAGRAGAALMHAAHALCGAVARTCGCGAPAALHRIAAPAACHAWCACKACTHIGTPAALHRRALFVLSVETSLASHAV